MAPPDPRSAPPDEPPASRGLAPIAAHPDAEVAGAWRDALIAAGVTAELHIEDAARFNLAASPWPTGAPFAYVLHAPRADRARAAAALIDAGWDGRAMPRGGARRAGRGGRRAAALLALGAALALAALLALQRAA